MSERQTTDPRIAAAAAWLMSDDTAYQHEPAMAERAARYMLIAADAVDPFRNLRIVHWEHQK